MGETQPRARHFPTTLGEQPANRRQRRRQRDIQDPAVGSVAADVCRADFRHARRSLIQIYDGNQSRAEQRRQTGGEPRHDSRHLHTSECAGTEKKSIRGCASL